MVRPMYLKLDDGVFDDDLNFLRDLFTLLDARLADLQKRIHECPDPDGMGLCDKGEYLAGMGFVACQRYLASTYGPLGLKKDVALASGPHHEGGETLVSIINAVANYWKHVDEWETITLTANEPGELNQIIVHNPDRLTPIQRKTIQVIESVTKWSDYTCANVLYELTAPVLHFAALIPLLEAWRDQMDAAHVG